MPSARAALDGSGTEQVTVCYGHSNFALGTWAPLRCEMCDLGTVLLKKHFAARLQRAAKAMKRVRVIAQDAIRSGVREAGLREMPNYSDAFPTARLGL
jgi:hypothetical protein